MTKERIGEVDYRSIDIKQSEGQREKNVWRQNTDP